MTRRRIVPLLAAALILGGVPTVLIPPAPPAGATGLGTALVSTTTTGAVGNQGGRSPRISGDGRFVAFSSTSNNLVAGDTNNLSDVFVRDAWYGVTTRVSVAANGAQANDASSRARISKDGRFVTFTSFAKNLVPGDDDFSEDVFIRDMATGAIEMAPSLPGGRSAADDISDDGRIVGFTSLGRLRLDDTNGVQDAFVFDRGMDIVKQ